MGRLGFFEHEGHPGNRKLFRPSWWGWGAVLVLYFANRGSPEELSPLLLVLKIIGLFGVYASVTLAVGATLRYDAARAPVPVAANFAPFVFALIVWL